MNATPEMIGQPSAWDKKQARLKAEREVREEGKEQPNLGIDASIEASMYEAMSDVSLQNLMEQAVAGQHKYAHIQRQLEAELARRRGESGATVDLTDEDGDDQSDAELPLAA